MHGIDDPDAPDDSALAAAACAGEVRAFEALVRRHESRVLRVLRLLGVHPQEREDVAQEVFLKVFRHQETFDRKRSFSSWIYKVSVNATHDWRDRRGSELDMEGVAEPSTPPSGYSYDGKLKAGIMLHDALCVFARVSPPAGAVLAEAAESIPVRIPPGLSGQEALSAGVAAAYDIMRDDEALRPAVRLSPAERGAHFRRLRAEYPRGREFGSHVVQEAEQGAVEVLRQLGFRVKREEGGLKIDN